MSRVRNQLSVPEETARIVRAAFPKSNSYNGLAVRVHRPFRRVNHQPL